RDHLRGVVLLQRRGLRQVRGELRVRLLADGAGVENQDVRVLLRGRLAEPELLEHALDPLAVVSVHLAAERRDVVPPHGPEWYRWSFGAHWALALQPRRRRRRSATTKPPPGDA